MYREVERTGVEDVNKFEVLFQHEGTNMTGSQSIFEWGTLSVLEIMYVYRILLSWLCCVPVKF